VQAAVTRSTAAGDPAGDWYPAEKITVEDALHHYTQGVADAAGDADSFCSIRRGSHADFVVLNTDPRTIDWSAGRPNVLMTAVAGEVVFNRGATDVM
jgi:hypothetical protein